MAHEQIRADAKAARKEIHAKAKAAFEELQASFKARVAGHYALGLLVLAALAAALALGPTHWFDIFGLSAAALGLNTLLFAGLARWLFDSGGGGHGEPLGRMLLLGLAAAALLAATVSVILRQHRAHEVLKDEAGMPS